MKSFSLATKLIGVGIIAVLVVGCGLWLKQWYIKRDSQKYAQLPLCLINVLDKNEFDDAHIPGSLHIPFDHIQSIIPLVPKDKPIIFYCANYLCSASGEAASLFIKHGFTHVYAYEGGMAEWYQKGAEDNAFFYEGPAQLSYLQVVIPNPHYKDIGDGDSKILKHIDGYVILSAQELHKMLKETNLIS